MSEKQTIAESWHQRSVELQARLTAVEQSLARECPKCGCSPDSLNSQDGCAGCLIEGLRERERLLADACLEAAEYVTTEPLRRRLRALADGTERAK